MEEEGQKLFLTAQKDPEIDMPEAEDLHKIGCVAVIKQIIKLPKNILRVLVAGECRAEFTEFEMTDPYYRAIICELPDENQLSDLVFRPIIRRFRGCAEVCRNYIIILLCGIRSIRGIW